MSTWIKRQPPRPAPTHHYETDDYTITIHRRERRYHYSIWWHATTTNLSSRHGCTTLRVAKDEALSKAKANQ